ncbi:TatD DNase family protein [Arcanobacterium wilhelmae]|uniref:TatD DNase family protein n=1 Tax=Arcanobacterium wilhelmae TaxID=1803177 RepID=A0ABT9NBX9_9ACTO|nr:TatD family hydrolase [Arcanobacterium wilhelmae]MDP9801205.1 TatD DNase family protein [Arcanobacterium wilhelmae]WFN90556.1 TatD family hydrolase [Arcanobacterium wilhelmae]
MGNSASKKRRRSLLPEVPPALAHSIVDNHTHIEIDGPGRSLDPADQRVSEDPPGWRYPPTLGNQLVAMESAGIRAAITSGCEVPALDPTLALAQQQPNIWAALAIHPNEAAMHAGVREIAPDGLEPNPEPHHEQFSLDEAIAQVAQLAKAPEVVAVGETGLDYFRTGDAGKEAQIRSFREHIALAKELGKPMQIHDRDAHADVVATLLADGAPEGTVFHCFSGDAELAQILAENGWYASFAGTVTYPANEFLREALAVLPPELVLVETDAPYLTPVPYRGHPNAIWGSAYTARALAEYRGVSEAEWCAQLDANTRRVYGI